MNEISYLSTKMPGLIRPMRH